MRARTHQPTHTHFGSHFFSTFILASFDFSKQNVTLMEIINPYPIFDNKFLQPKFFSTDLTEL